MPSQRLPLLALVIGLMANGLAFGQSAQDTTDVSLQSRVDAIAQQIHLRHRYHEPTLAEQRGQIESVLAGWNAAQRGDSPENQERMKAWLNRALYAVMPGGSGKLPAAPVFVETVIARSENLTTIEPIDSTAGSEAREEASVIEPSSVLPPPVRAEPSKPAKPQPVIPQLVQSERRQERSVAKPITEFAEDRPERTTPRPTRSKWSRHPSAAPLEWRDPFAADPAASPNPLRSGARHETRRPAFRSYTGARVNRTQLKAEVRGYNQALRDLQLVVMNLEAGDVFGLADAAERLEELEQQRRFLDLYREGLSSDELNRLPESPSAELVRELVRRKASDLSRRAPLKQRAERRALERLNNRLAGLDAGNQSNR